MKIKIEIDCDTVEEVLTHISVIRMDIKRTLVRHGVTPVKFVRLDDHNCYGEHTVSINNTGKHASI